MKLLHITSHLNVGGVTSSVLSLSGELARRGHQVAIASGGGAFALEAERRGVACWPVPVSTSVEFSPPVFAAAARLRRRLQEEPVDLLHAHTRVGQVVAAWLSRRLGVPYLATWHGFFHPNLGRRLWPCTGDLTIAISEPVRRHLVEVFRIPSERIRLIPHGINPAPFAAQPDPAAQQRVRHQAGLPGQGPVVGTVARLVAAKRIDHLIRSLVPLRAQVPKARLLIVGDGEERPSLERLARALGIAEAVHFAGTLPETNTALSLMDVFVFMPADQEGFGLSLLEAMACGRPIVGVRRGGGAAWVLEDSGVGLLVEPDDPAALASSVARLLQNGELASREALRARAVLLERYTLTRMVDQVEAAYRELATP